MWVPRIGNCYLFAFVNRLKYGGKLLTGASQYGWWPHIQWEDAHGIIHEYVPALRIRKRGLGYYFPVRILFFRGRVEYAGRRCTRVPCRGKAATREYNDKHCCG